MGVQPSSGVCELIDRIWATADAQDGEQMSQLHADDPNLVFVGGAPNEAWHGFAEVREALRARHDGTAPVGFQLERCAAFEDGDVGWGMGEGFFRFEGRRYPFRLTAVARREPNGTWKSIFTQVGVPLRDDVFSEQLAVPGTD